jgi:TPR repeat protein
MDEFVAEAKSSPMLAEEKRHLEAEANWLKGDQAQLDQDYKAAIDYFRKSYTLYPKQVWRLDNAAGAALAGNMKDEALKILSEVLLADPKEAWALNKRGYLYEAYVQDNSKAFKDYVTAADAGNSWAQNRVGWWYLTGTAVTKDTERAEAYFRLAAAQGNENAKGNLKALLETKRSASK